VRAAIKACAQQDCAGRLSFCYANETHTVSALWLFLRAPNRLLLFIKRVAVLWLGAQYLINLKELVAPPAFYNSQPFWRRIFITCHFTASGSLQQQRSSARMN
jgi:hypothetical protein